MLRKDFKMGFIYKKWSPRGSDEVLDTNMLWKVAKCKVGFTTWNYTMIAFQNVLYQVFDKLYLVSLFSSYLIFSKTIRVFFFFYFIKMDSNLNLRGFLISSETDPALD